jgi:hypothetical protein
MNFKNPARFTHFLNSENNENSPRVLLWVKITSQRGVLFLNYTSTFRVFDAMRLNVCQTHLVYRVQKSFHTITE